MEWFYNDGSPLGDAINEIREGVSDVTVTVLVTDQTGYPSSSSKRGRNGDGIVEGAPIHDVGRLPTESKFRRTDAESETLHDGTTSKSRRGLGRRSPDPPDDYNDYDDDVFVWSEEGAEGGTATTTATNTTAPVASPAIKATKAAKTDVPVPAPSAAAADPTLRQTSTGAPATGAPAIGAPSVKPRRTRPPRATRAPRRPRTGRPRTGRPRRTRRPVAEGTSSPTIGGTTQAPAPTVSGQTNAPTILPPSGSTSAPTIGGATVAPTPSGSGQTNAPTIPQPSGSTGAPTIGGTTVAPTPSGSGQTNAPTIPPPTGTTGAPTMGGSTENPTPSDENEDDNNDDNDDGGGGGENNGCPANESYLGLDVVITISYRLTGVSEDFTVEEILAAPFSEEIYRSIYRTQYLNIGPFKDLRCTGELLFEPRPPPETGT